MSVSSGTASSRAASPVTSAARSGLTSSGSAASPATPSSTSTSRKLMPGFVVHDNRAAIQESIYIVLGHGPYQRRVLLCSVLSVIVALFQALSDRLTSRPVDHWCRPPKNLRELSADAWKNMSIPVEADGSFSKCTVYDPVVADTHAANRSTAACQSWDYDIANRADSIVSRFGLICDRQYLLNLGTGIFVVISALVTPVLGFASHRVGRRPVTLASVIVLLTGTVGNSVSGTSTFYVSTRTVVLTTANTVFMLIFILLYEVTGKQWRLLFTILVTAVGITVVPPFVDALSLLKPRWVLLHGVIIVPTAILVAWCCLLRESPTWLLATWDVQRAQEGVVEAAILNGLDTAKAAATFRAILVQLINIDQSQHSSTDASYGHVQSVKMRRQVASVFLARLTLNAIYFPLVVKGHSPGYYWLAVQTVLLAASYVTVCWAVVKRGLRDTLIVLLVIVCALSAVQTMLMSVSGLQMVIPVVDAALKVALAGSMSVTLCYSAEVFPTSIRCAGVSASMFFGYAGSLLGILAHALSGRKIGSLFHGTAAILTALSVFAVQWLPEALVETRKAKREAAPASAQEREEALKQSLALPFEDEKRRRRRKGQMKTPNKSPA
ncbi:organic anion transporter 3-like [Dermacentor albipictus]|uniref:organic anion transporter 3-like n=1 Tax=Dermacentor albipictus TaxID=60249 RepID=UPI0038FC634D